MAGQHRKCRGGRGFYHTRGVGLARLGFMLWMNAFVFRVEQFFELANVSVELFRVILDLKFLAQPFKTFAFFRRHHRKLS